MIKKKPSLDGFEPSTFRLTAERANQLRHRDYTTNFLIFKINIHSKNLILFKNIKFKFEIGLNQRMKEMGN